MRPLLNARAVTAVWRPSFWIAIVVIACLNADVLALTDGVQITFDVQNDSWPTWSPDGNLIAFASERGPDFAYRIWVIPSIGGIATQITHGPLEDVEPAWSGGGDLIAFTRRNFSGSDIWVVPATGGSEVQITTDGGSGAPAWSPDDTQIAFSREGNIWTIPSAGGTSTQITTGGGGEPTWSPDGTQIAFASDRTGVSSIWVVPATGGPETQIRTDYGKQPDWSPDGSLIAFSGPAYEGPSWGCICVMPATGGPHTVITLPEAGNPGGDQSPAWSPNGSAIAYHSDDSCTEFNGDCTDISVVAYPPAVALDQESWGSIKEKYRD